MPNGRKLKIGNPLPYSRDRFLSGSFFILGNCIIRNAPIIIEKSLSKGNVSIVEQNLMTFYCRHIEELMRRKNEDRIKRGIQKNYLQRSDQYKISI